MKHALITSEGVRKCLSIFKVRQLGNYEDLATCSAELLRFPAVNGKMFEMVFQLVARSTRADRCVQFYRLLEWWSAPFLLARTMATGEAAVLPTSLPDSTLTTGPTSRVRRSGVSFEVPWTETDQSKSAFKGETLMFTNGLEMFVGRPTTNLEIIRTTKGIRAAAVRYELGLDVLSSQFALTSAALGTTGNDVKWWRTPIYNEKVETLLMEKTGITGTRNASE